MNKTAKKNIIVLLATLVFTLAFATTCFAKSSPTATVIPTTTVNPTTKAPTTVKPTKNNETTKKKQKKQKTIKKDETTTGSGSGNGRYNGRRRCPPPPRRGVCRCGSGTRTGPRASAWDARWLSPWGTPAHLSLIHI